MNIRQEDIDALKAPDVMHAYCERELGAGRRRGALTFYPCPWGVHERLKLEVTERNGCGVALCRACNRGGSVLDVAAGVLGMDARRDFTAVAEHVAQAVGFSLRGDVAPGRRRAQRHVSVKPRQALERAEDTPPLYLPAEAEKAALDAVRRAAAAPVAMACHALQLGLPTSCMTMHTDMQLADCGLLGLSPRGHLLYVYSCHDATGAVRVQMVKQRSKPEEIAKGKQRFYCTKGSHKQALYGAGYIDVSGCVVITEGETDCLALRAALDTWLRYRLSCEPDSYPTRELIPSIVAKPDAGTFRAAWAEPLRGRDVILCVDNDEAGRKGAAATADILKAAGVCRVFAWFPPQNCKDARDAYRRLSPFDLIHSLLINKIEL